MLAAPNFSSEGPSPAPRRALDSARAHAAPRARGTRPNLPGGPNWFEDEPRSRDPQVGASSTRRCVVELSVAEHTTRVSSFKARTRHGKGIGVGPKRCAVVPWARAIAPGGAGSG